MTKVLKALGLVVLLTFALFAVFTCAGAVGVAQTASEPNAVIRHHPDGWVTANPYVSGICVAHPSRDQQTAVFYCAPDTYRAPPTIPGPSRPPVAPLDTAPPQGYPGREGALDHDRYPTGHRDVPHP